MGVDGFIREQVEDILKNHDQEIRTIEAQIKAERAVLEEDLEEIRSRAYPRGVQYESVRVQTSPDPDRKLVHMVDDITRREATANQAIEALEERRRQIESVRHNILSLDAKSKCVLLTLYYPKRTYEESAEILDCDRSTIARLRKTAVDRLVRRIARMNTEESTCPHPQTKK